MHLTTLAFIAILAAGSTSCSNMTKDKKDDNTKSEPTQGEAQAGGTTKEIKLIEIEDYTAIAFCATTTHTFTATTSKLAYEDCERLEDEIGESRKTRNLTLDSTEKKKLYDLVKRARAEGGEGSTCPGGALTINVSYTDSSKETLRPDICAHVSDDVVAWLNEVSNQ